MRCLDHRGEKAGLRSSTGYPRAAFSGVVVGWNWRKSGASLNIFSYPGMFFPLNQIDQNMDTTTKDILWNQFGASIDMLINAIASCSEQYYNLHPGFFYRAYHTALFLDYYLTVPPQDFKPLLPFEQKAKEDLPPYAIGDLVPARYYSRAEMLTYLQSTRAKAQQLLAAWNDDGPHPPGRFTEGNEPGDMDYPLLEILLYNLRHTQHHVGQLHLLLRQEEQQHLEWSFRVGDLPSGEEAAKNGSRSDKEGI